MRNSARLLMLLLAMALIVSSAAALYWMYAWDDDLAIGLALGQTQLAAAAAVLWQRRLLLSLTALVGAITFWMTALVGAASSDVQTLLVFTWEFVGAALLTALWCGAHVFFGWRVVYADAAAQQPLAKPHQFSLATVLLAMCIICGYLGVARLSGFTVGDVVDLALVLLIALAGCTALTCSAGRWHWAPLAVVVAIGCAAIPWTISNENVYGYAVSSIWRVSLALLAVLGSAVLVLHVAGIRWARSRSATPTPMHRPLHGVAPH